MFVNAPACVFAAGSACAHNVVSYDDFSRHLLVGSAFGWNLPPLVPAAKNCHSMARKKILIHDKNESLKRFERDIFFSKLQ